MKAFLILLALCVNLCAEEAVLLVGQRVFRGALVGRLDAFTARVTHENGMATVPAWELSDALQRKYGFDPAATSAERKRREDARTEAARKAVEKTARVADEEKARQKMLAEQEKENQERVRKAAEVVAKDKSDWEEQRRQAYNREFLRTGRQSWLAINPMVAAGIESHLRKHGPMPRSEYQTMSEETKVALRAIPGALAPGVLDDPVASASAEEQLRAAALRQYLEKFGPFTPEQFSKLSPQDRLSARRFVPGVVPK